MDLEIANKIFSIIFLGLMGSMVLIIIGKLIHDKIKYGRFFEKDKVFRCCFKECDFEHDSIIEVIRHMEEMHKLRVNEKRILKE